MSAAVWIVLVEDRHVDVDAFPFSSEDRAVGAARAAAEENAAHGVDPDGELTPAMLEDGWVLCIPYGTEGDMVRVVKRTMDAVQSADAGHQGRTAP